jgi:alpha-1,2-glucosyltransferase
MDEVFHIPQAQQYCAFNFSEWDPMITTLPGLYFISFLLLYPLSVAFSIDLISLCTPFTLRLTNLFLWVANVIPGYRILFKLNWEVYKSRCNELKGNEHERPHGVQPVKGQVVNKAKELVIKEECFLLSVVISTFPVLYFFTFLYYTDMASTAFVLLTYYCALSGQHYRSAVAGLVAILCRQTNIVWVGFSAAVVALAELFSYAEMVLKKLEGDTMNTQPPFVDVALLLISQSKKRLLTLIDILWPYLAVLIAFVVFAYVNEGVVVGDRSSHQLSFHLPQLLYFYAFTLAWSFVHVASISNIQMTLVWLMRHKVISLLMVVALMSLCFLAIHNFTIVHPYLRDDNRHLMFYVWRKLFARHRMMKYAWIPLYTSSIMLIHMKLCNDCVISKMISHAYLSHIIGVLWQLVFILCAALPVILQQLLEPRYFIMPYIMLRLHLTVQCHHRLSLVVEFLVYFLVDIAVLFLFLFRPFEWQHEPGIIQRFLW